MLLLGLGVLLSAGCSSVRLPDFVPTPRPQPVERAISPDLLTCEPIPERLADTPWPTNEQTIAHYEAVRLAGETCWRKMEAARETLTAP